MTTTSKKESELWRAVMAHVYGEEWKEMLEEQVGMCLRMHIALGFTGGAAACRYLREHGLRVRDNTVRLWYDLYARTSTDEGRIDRVTHADLCNLAPIRP